MQTQVLGQWVTPPRPAFTLGRESYQNGKWVEITYGRPLQRGRDLFGSGAELAPEHVRIMASFANPFVGVAESADGRWVRATAVLVGVAFVCFSAAILKGFA